MRRLSPHLRKALYGHNTLPKSLICILKKTDNEYALISIIFNGFEVAKSKTLRIFKHPHIPSELMELSDKNSNDIILITRSSLLISLYGLVYPIFSIDDKIYLSFFVRQNHYSAITIGKFLESAAFLLSELTDIDPKGINAKLTLKSPGDIVLYFLSNIKDNWMIILLLFILTFGGKYEAKDISIESPSIRNLIMSILDYKNKKRLRELEVREKELDIEKKEQEINLIRLKMEKEKNNFDETIEKLDYLMQNIKDSAEDMNAEMPPKDLMNIERIITIIENQEKIDIQ